MNVITSSGRTDAYGKLNLEIQTGDANADMEVVVVYRVKKVWTQEEHEQWVNETYGSLADDPIEIDEEPLPVLHGEAR